MKNTLSCSFILLLSISLLFGCNPVEISKELKKDLVGKNWMSRYMRDANGNTFANEAYSITSFYEQGFKLKSNGTYVSKYSNGSNTTNRASWQLDDSENNLIIETDAGDTYNYEIISADSDTLELFFASGFLILTAE